MLVKRCNVCLLITKHLHNVLDFDFLGLLVMISGALLLYHKHTYNYVTGFEKTYTTARLSLYTIIVLAAGDPNPTTPVQI